MSPLIIQNLHKSYGSFSAVNNVSFEMKAGEIYGLLGPNGAGKTSIISCIVTLQEPTAGEILLFGKNPKKLALGDVFEDLPEHRYFSLYNIFFATQTLKK